MFGEVLQTICYGTFKDGDVDFVVLGAKAMQIFSTTLIAPYAVNYVPACTSIRMSDLTALLTGSSSSEVRS